MGKKGFLCAIACCILGIAAVNAQDASKLSDVIGTDFATYGQISYLSAIELGLIADDASYETAVVALKQQHFLKETVSASDIIPLTDVAFICSKTWDIKPSLLYRIFKNPHYAFKQLQAVGIISSLSDPHHKLSGHEVLNIISACIDYSER